TDQVAKIGPAGFEFGTLTGRNLQLSADQQLSIGNRPHARKLENQPLLVRPQTFHHNCASLIASEQRPQPHALAETIRNIGVEFDCDFATAALGFDYSRQANKLAARFRSRYSMISNA